MSGEDVVKKIQEKIIPSVEESLYVEQVAEKLKNSVLEELGDINYKVELCGSIAKGTYLKNPDIDIFVIFPIDSTILLMRNTVRELGKKLLERSFEKYAQHPYTKGKYEGFDVDIVPCYDIPESSNIKSAVDRTPYHTRFIKEHLSDEQKKDIRILKKFMKAIGVYGADNATQGFSGYLTELLIYQYGSFLKAVEEFSKWKHITRIGHWEGADDGPLIFVDPIDKNRNVASAVSAKSYYTLIAASIDFIRHPAETFFFPEKKKIPNKEDMYSFSEFMKDNLYAITFEIEEENDDITIPQIRRSANGIEKKLNGAGFTVKDMAFFIKNSIGIIMFLFEFSGYRTDLHLGPPVSSANSVNFREKWKEYHPFIKNGSWAVIKPDKYGTSYAALCSAIKLAAHGKNIKDSLKNSKILSYGEIIEEFPEEFYQFVYHPIPWM